MCGAIGTANGCLAGEVCAPGGTQNQNVGVCVGGCFSAMECSNGDVCCGNGVAASAVVGTCMTVAACQGELTPFCGMENIGTSNMCPTGEFCGQSSTPSGAVVGVCMPIVGGTRPPVGDGESTDGGADVAIPIRLVTGGGGTTDSGGTTGNGGTTGSAGITGSGAGSSGACNDLTVAANQTTAVESDHSSGPPAPQGGTIASGTYFLSMFTVYGGYTMGGINYQATANISYMGGLLTVNTIEIDPGVMRSSTNFYQHQDAGTDAYGNVDANHSADGGVNTHPCGNSQFFLNAFTYTATPTQITVYVQGAPPGETLAYVWSLSST
jgi:hypothetical protein